MNTILPRLDERTPTQAYFDMTREDDEIFRRFTDAPENSEHIFQSLYDDIRDYQEMNCFYGVEPEGRNLIVLAHAHYIERCGLPDYGTGYEF